MYRQFMGYAYNPFTVDINCCGIEIVNCCLCFFQAAFFGGRGGSKVANEMQKERLFNVCTFLFLF